MVDRQDPDLKDLERTEGELGMTAEAPGANGYKNDRKPGQDELLGMRAGRGGGGGYDAIQQMAEGSEEASKYLVRTIIAEDELQDDIIESSELMWALFGYIDVPYLHWLRYHLRVSIDGAGRKQVENMFIGERQYRKDMFSGALRGGAVLRRAKTFNNEEVQISA